MKKIVKKFLQKVKVYFNVDLWSVIYGVYAVLPMMRKQGHGHIITTLSLAGLMPTPYQMIYATTKYAVRALSECLRYEMAHENIRFSCICPGNVATPVLPCPIWTILR